MAEDGGRRWLHLELATDDSWRLDGKAFERGNHPEALEPSLSPGSVSNALQIGCGTGAFGENFRPTTAGSRSSPSCGERKLEGGTEERAQHVCLRVGEVEMFSSQEPSI
ncbi:SAM-dependent methyltransferase [Mesorhizobium sp. 43Arga]